MIDAVEAKPDRADEAPAEYRSLSAMAIVACLLGISSVLALIGPLFLVVPAAAAAAALLAFAQIRRSDGALTGGNLARWGLVLAAAIATAAIIRDVTRDELLKRQAVAAAERWLQALAEERFDDAVELLTPQTAQSFVPRRERGAEPPPPEELKAIAVDHLRSDPVSAALATGNGGRGGFEFVSASRPSIDATRTGVASTFAIGPLGAAQKSVTIQLTRAQVFEESGLPWRVEFWTMGGQPPAL